MAWKKITDTEKKKEFRKRLHKKSLLCKTMSIVIRMRRWLKISFFGTKKWILVTIKEDFDVSFYLVLAWSGFNEYKISSFHNQVSVEPSHAKDIRIDVVDQTHFK